LLIPDQELGSNRRDVVLGIPVAAHAEVVTTRFVVEVIVEAAQLPILKAHAYETGSPGNRRRHNLHDHADAPLFVTKMGDFVSDAEEKALSFRHGRTSRPKITSLSRQINAIFGGSARFHPLARCV
jgi:hypothetical protein